jgi:hypothetical protein
VVQVILGQGVAVLYGVSPEVGFAFYIQHHLYHFDSTVFFSDKMLTDLEQCTVAREV